MMYYLFSTMIFLIFVFSVTNQGGRCKFFLTLFVYFLFCFFIGLRFETGGPDWISYKRFYHSIEPLTSVIMGDISYKDSVLYQHGFEFIFKLYSSIVKILFDNYVYLQLFSVMFTFFVLYRFFIKSSPYPILSVFIYVSSISLLGDMTIIRQMIAVSFFILSLDSLIQRNKGKYFAINLIAVFFHFSAIIIFPLYFLYPVLIKRKVYIPVILLLVLINIVFSSFIMSIMDILSGFSSIGFALMLKIKQYQLELSTVNISFGFGFIERLIMVFFIVLYSDKIKKKFPIYGELILFLVICNVLLSFLFVSFTTFYLRFRYYFIFSNSIFYVYIICLISKDKLQVICYSLILYVYGMFWVNVIVQSNKSQYLPYQNYVEYLITGDKVDRLYLINTRS